MCKYTATMYVYIKIEAYKIVCTRARLQPQHQISLSSIFIQSK